MRRTFDDLPTHEPMARHRVPRMRPTDKRYHHPRKVDCEWCGAEIRAAAELSGDEITECEGWFSRSACDSCGCHLGGTRYHAHCSPLPAGVAS